MKISDIEIDPPFFFKVGMWCFILIGVFSILNFFSGVHVHTLWSGLSTWVSIFFNFIVAGFFHYMLKQSAPQVTTEYESNDISELIKEVKKNANNKEGTDGDNKSSD